MEPFRTEVAISRMYRVCQECSGFIGTARLCPHSFSPPVTITPLKTNGRSSSCRAARLEYQFASVWLITDRTRAPTTEKSVHSFFTTVRQTLRTTRSAKDRPVARKRRVAVRRSSGDIAFRSIVSFCYKRNQFFDHIALFFRFFLNTPSSSNTMTAAATFFEKLMFATGRARLAGVWGPYCTSSWATDLCEDLIKQSKRESRCSTRSKSSIFHCPLSLSRGSSSVAAELCIEESLPERIHGLLNLVYMIVYSVLYEINIRGYKKAP
ncbi:hypothetical protein J6590_102002 [Homalodisca vitripennis]|nr:hypothetical protein J6590_102002 [Homalodisca vitripennis]